MKNKKIHVNYYCEEGCGTPSEMNCEKFKQGKCHVMPKGYNPKNKKRWDNTSRIG
jgi:hypothetical protein